MLRKPRMCSAMQCFRRYSRDERGVTAIEFSLLAAPFFLLTFAILETALILVAGLTLDRAANDAMRIVRTGEALNRDYNEAAIRETICAGLFGLFDCDDLQLDLKTYDDYASMPSAPPVSNGVLDKSGFRFELGDSESLMLMRVYYEWPVVTDFFRKSLSNMQSGDFLMSSVSIARVEPIDAGNP